MENNWRIADLIGKHLREEMIEDERQELEAWLSESEANRIFFERYKNDEYVRGELALIANADTESSLNKTLERLGVEKKTGYNARLEEVCNSSGSAAGCIHRRLVPFKNKAYA